MSDDARRELAWITVVYLAVRSLLIVAAVLLSAFGHHPLGSELANWDGVWYRAIAEHGYPHHQALDSQTNLGFFPLFPLTIALVSPVLQLVLGAGATSAATVAGVLISALGGLVATIFVHRLAEGWWDRATARRATIIFVVFPGAVVFSMVYSEALLLPLAAICIWALERRRWMLAGAVAGLATAANAAGFVLCLACAVCALQELWRHGPRSHDFRRSAAGTAMSTAGAVAFLAFLWAWTGDPFADYVAQRDGWNRRTDPLAIVRQFERLASSLGSGHLEHPLILNDLLGTLLVVLMAVELCLLWRSRRELSAPALVWALGVTALTATAEYVPPNPRLLLTAFPMLVLLARWTSGPRFARLVWVNVVLLVGLSVLTFAPDLLLP